jgi:serine/threonine-protein kinase
MSEDRAGRHAGGSIVDTTRANTSPEQIKKDNERHERQQRAEGKPRSPATVVAECRTIVIKPQVSRGITSRRWRSSASAAVPSPGATTIMTILAGRYRLQATIARGGMAVVHRAEDTVLKRAVAVKTLPLERASSAALRQAVFHEALTTARLSHPNIVRLLDYGETRRHDQRLPFLVMELIAGEPLSQRLARHGPMPWPEATRICARVAEALAAAHAENLVHRDVKPANIMVSPSGVKVIDLGVAARPGHTTDAAGRVWGTPGYLAPEQLLGQPTSPAADIYALGLVLRACLTGRPAWPGATADEVLVARACTPVPALPRSDDLPESLLRLYRACLHRSPGRRPAARQLARLLAAVAAGRLADPGQARRWHLFPAVARAD